MRENISKKIVKFFLNPQVCEIFLNAQVCEIFLNAEVLNKAAQGELFFQKQLKHMGVY